jgi:hypothetical protein
MSNPRFVAHELVPRVVFVMRLDGEWHETPGLGKVVWPEDIKAAEPLHRQAYEQLACECGSVDFEVFYTDDYETSVRCKSCGNWHVVHSG